ncbi:MAG: HutP family protein [Negativicutes bacterium]|jgi:HutP.
MTTAQGFMENSVNSVGTAALLLALTQTMYDEERAKQLVAKKDFKAAVTEVGGQTTLNEFNEKVNRAVIGAALNSGIIQKCTNDIHALIHATEEAKKGVMIGANTNQNLALKMAMVRDDTWIAVAMFGKSAVHYMTNHDRGGLGIMHI